MTARRHTMSRRTLLAATAAAPLAAPLPLRASTYPERPLTVLVPFATGGYNDRYARAIAPFLQKHFGQLPAAARCSATCSISSSRMTATW